MNGAQCLIPPHLLSDIMESESDSNDESLVCSQCRRGKDENGPRLLRCSRCQAAHYCSRECQTKHFSFHKASCKKVHQLTQSIPSETESAALQHIQAGHALIVMGYRELDTIAHAKSYYRKALSAYLQASTLLVSGPSGGDDPLLPPLMDAILLLVAMLGSNPDVLQSVRQVFVANTVLADDETTTSYSFASLLASMRHYIGQRSSALSKDIEAQLQSSTFHDSMGGMSLVHLRDTVPFLPAHAPELVRPFPSYNTATAVPTEFWYMYQDSFFLTPGLNDVLHHFVPDQELLDAEYAEQRS
eukprot:Nitzschia sp. Nitz4//scaffold89_size161592//48550//49452//NITZ4_002370-RA/size161592-processed-gene-0.9-mRNA-1//1//CDS//3329559592//5339//frame0